jgi:hypothetical protein
MQAGNRPLAALLAISLGLFGAACVDVSWFHFAITVSVATLSVKHEAFQPLLFWAEITRSVGRHQIVSYLPTAAVGAIRSNDRNWPGALGDHWQQSGSEVQWLLCGGKL